MQIGKCKKKTRFFQFQWSNIRKYQKIAQNSLKTILKEVNYNFQN